MVDVVNWIYSNPLGTRPLMGPPTNREQRAVREPMSAWVAGGAVVASVATGGLFLVWGLESLLPALGVPASIWLLVAVLPLYYLWRRVGGQTTLEARQVGLIIIAVIALDAAFDAAVWAAKAALVVAAVVLIVAARRRAATMNRS
jgi:hypothetical protein